MNKANTQSSSFTKVYKRESQTPWPDMSNMLLLASKVERRGNVLELNYERYIYAHKDVSGKILGISVSKQIERENPHLYSRYIHGKEMYAFLLLYIDEIASFCELFQDEFIEMFLMPPQVYFLCAKKYWNEVVSTI